MNKQKNIVSFPDRKVIEEEAATWVAHMDTRALSAEQRSGFQKWVNQSAQHREAIEHLSLIWGGCDILDELNYIDHETESLDLASIEKKTKTSWLQIAIAASVVFGFSALSYQSFSNVEQYQEGYFITAVGDQKTIALIDGSTIILNTNSEIDIKITPTSRTIKLFKGEAHFQVASDNKRPFEVYAGDGAVEAVGTAFTVYLRDDDVEVTVTEGVVKLLAQPETQNNVPSIEMDDSPKSNLTTIAALTAGQNAIFAEKVESLEWMSEEALQQKLLWREGFVIFAGEPLSKVVADISRYTNIIIEIEESSLEETPIGGRFKVGDVEGMFEALENIFGVRVNRISPSLVKLSLPLRF